MGEHDFRQRRNREGRGGERGGDERLRFAKFLETGTFRVVIVERKNNIKYNLGDFNHIQGGLC